MSNVLKLQLDHDEISNEIGLLQLRRILLISYDMNCYGNCLEFVYHGDNYALTEINNRLVLTPGYQMFLNNVENVSFYAERRTYVVEYTYKNRLYKVPLVKEEGIYLDDFSHTDDGDDER